MDWIKPDSFIKREHLNKSFSIHKIEIEMVNFFEKIKMELKIINDMENIYEDAYLDYQKSLDLKEILNKNNNLTKRSKEPSFPCKISITIGNSVKLEEVSDLLKEKNIKYKIQNIDSF